jgi:hypothetical protein
MILLSRDIFESSRWHGERACDSRCESDFNIPLQERYCTLRV